MTTPPCDFENFTGNGIKCAATPTHVCACRRCDSEPTEEEKFHTCDAHRDSVSTAHQRMRGRDAVWVNRPTPPEAAAPIEPDLTARLLQGLQAAKDLHTLTDQLTEELQGVEVAFKDLRLGVSASVPLTEELTLHFEKDGKTWRFTVKSATGSQFLVNASRAARVLAVGKLNALLEVLVEEAIQKADAVRKACEEAKAYHVELRAFVQAHGPKDGEDSE